MGSAQPLKIAKGLQVMVIYGLAVLALNAQAEPYNSPAFGMGYHQPDYTLGVQAFRAGDYSQAAHYFGKVIQEDSRNANAHYYLGLSLDRLGLVAEALSEYQVVIRQGQEAQIVHYAHERINALAATIPAQPVATGMQNAVLQPDFKQTALVPVSNNMDKSRDVPVKVLLKETQNALMVDATLRQDERTTSGAFIIDTGATYTSISVQMAENLGLDLRGCEKILITTANGRIEVPKIMIQRLEVNGLQAQNVEATVIPVRSGSSFSGLLGLSFMRQFVVTIDPQAGHLIFRKNEPMF